MKNCTFLLLPLLISLLSACQSNKYSDYYSVLIDDNYVRIDEPAKLIELADSSQIAKLQATDDYILIGTSSFYDLCSRLCKKIWCMYGRAFIPKR